MRPRLLLVLAATLLAAACDTPLQLSSVAPLEIEVSRFALRLKNNLDETVYTFVIERETATRTDWIPCVVPERCDGIEGGGARRIGYGEIFGYEGGDAEAIVYWWVLAPAPGGGYRADGLQSEVVRLYRP